MFFLPKPESWKPVYHQIKWDYNTNLNRQDPYNPKKKEDFILNNLP